MSPDTIQNLTLESLQSIPVVGQAAPFYEQNCMVCFDSQGHASGIEMTVVYKGSTETCRVHWSGIVTEQLRKARADLVEAVEFAAEAITFLLMPELTGLTAIEQAQRGTRIDYYLAPNSQEDILIFNRAARLEISGLLTENEENTVEDRIRDKLARLQRSSEDLPAYVSVVEFSQPWSKIVEA